VTTVMVVVMIVWSGITIAVKPEAQRLPPLPVAQNLSFSHDAVGWLPQLLPGSFVEQAANSANSSPEAAGAESRFGLLTHPGMLLGLIGLLIAFGHSFLAMSGEESLAQVNRELEYPKHKNLMRAGMVIFVYSLLFTSLVSFFAYAIIPDSLHSRYADNLISGIAMNVVGPLPLKLIFQAFIVIVGFLMLAGAVNTSIIGSNGVLNRVSEDGVLTDWFRAPHHRFGTTYRMINLIVILQLVTIIGSQGNVYTLGEAYAFGVIWSFAFKGLAMLVLRFSDKSHREWKVPFNLKLGNTEVPLGLGMIALLLFSVAIINLFTKQVATVSGVAFTLVFFIVFSVSEQINERKRGGAHHEEVDQFRLHPQEEISASTVGIRPRNTLCLVRDYQTLDHVKRALEITHTGKKSLVMMTVRLFSGPDSGYADIHPDQLFTSYEQKLFSKVVSLAEKVGKHVDLLVVPSSDVYQAIVRAAVQLDSSDIIAGASSVMSPEEQARLIGSAWERLPEKPARSVRFRVVKHDGSIQDFYLGAHAPQLTADDIDRIHRLWLLLTTMPNQEQLHHRDVVEMAISRLEGEINGYEGEELEHHLALHAASLP
ncbi:MAG: APC family permease, partial [Caldilineaceae bacterium]